MRFRVSRSLLTLLLTPALLASAFVVPRGAAAQDKGVSLSLQYRPGQKTTLIVLPIAGIKGDSLARIISRDLDYSDRFTMVSTSSAPTINGPLNYALFTKLGVDGIVQATVLPSGWLRVALHDVGLKAVRNTKDFPLPVPVQSAGWRLAVHGVSDGIEEWVTGVRGIAQTRIAFTRGGRVWTTDSDGANVTAVTPSGMSPQWLPSGRGIVYSVLDGVRNPIMFTDLATGAQRVWRVRRVSSIRRRWSRQMGERSCTRAARMWERTCISNPSMAALRGGSRWAGVARVHKRASALMGSGWPSCLIAPGIPKCILVIWTVRTPSC